VVIRDELFKSFLEYFSLKDIDVVENFQDYKLPQLEDIDEEKLEDQLSNISEFHKNVMGYKGYMGKRLDNKTGSVVEQYKVNIKRLRRYLKNIRVNAATSNFERLLLKEGFEYLQRAEMCISEVFNSGYMSIIERSMKRTEICLGLTDFNNLRKNNEKIELLSLDKCCYNNVEMDCFYLLNKYRRKGVKLDYKRLASKFCQYEGLDENSSKYILALLSYPYGFMKCCNRYREKTKEWSEEEYKDSLLKEIVKDGEMLVK
jgi:hypothetical protein